MLQPKDEWENPLVKLKGTDASSLPPCEADMKLHIRCFAFVAKMWAEADQHTLTQSPDPENGWNLINGAYI